MIKYINIIKMTVLPKIRYIFNAISNKTLMAFFKDIKQKNNPQICIKPQGPKVAKAILRG